MASTIAMSMAPCAAAAGRARSQRPLGQQPTAPGVVLNRSRGVVGASVVSAVNRTSPARVAATSAARVPVTMAAASSASTVRIIIQGRKIEVTPSIRDYCEEKVTKALSHFEGQIKEVDVKLSVRGGDAGTGPKEQRTEITAYTLRHGVVRAEDVEDNLYASVDLVCDKLQRKMRKLKEKAVDRGNWHGRGGKAGQTQIYEVLSSQDVVDDLELDRVAELPKEVVRAKHVQLEPLTVEEATERMEAIGHDFFVFLERDSNTIQVLYQRKVNGYGVLIPQDQ